MTWTQLALLLGGLLSLACDASPSEAVLLPSTAERRQSIEGGDASPPGAWPNVVQLDNGCTGVLVQPSLILTAAHCGPASRVWFGSEFALSALDGSHSQEAWTVTPLGSYESRRVVHCGSPRRAELGSGSDLQYCVLDGEARDVALVPIAHACELDRTIDRDRALLVGFGSSTLDAATSGPKRRVLAPVTERSLELTIGSEEHGTCHGDSGGPAFVQVFDAASPSGWDWRLLGVLSSGFAGQCGTGFYTDLTRHVGWLEAETRLDLSPCFSSLGAWEPSPSCRVTGLNEEGLPSATHAREPMASTCGEPSNAVALPSEMFAHGGCTLAGHRPSEECPASAAILLLLFGVLQARRCQARRWHAQRRGSPRVPAATHPC